MAKIYPELKADMIVLRTQALVINPITTTVLTFFSLKLSLRIKLSEWLRVTSDIYLILFCKIRQKYSLWRLAQFGVPRSISEEREHPDHQPGQGEVPPTTATTQISLIGGKRTILTLFIRNQCTSQIFLSDMNHLDFRISAKSENIPDILLKFWKQLSYWRLIITSLKINAQ